MNENMRNANKMNIKESHKNEENCKEKKEEKINRNECEIAMRKYQYHIILYHTMLFFLIMTNQFIDFPRFPLLLLL